MIIILHFVLVVLLTAISKKNTPDYFSTADAIALDYKPQAIPEHHVS